MKLSRTRLALGVGALVVAAFDTGYAQSWSPQTDGWGEAVQGLRIALSVRQPPYSETVDAEVYVAVQNVGDSDTVVNIGSMLANGRVMFPTAITLTFTDATGRARELQFWDRRYPAIAGRVDDFLIPLRSGSTHVLRTFLHQYWSPATHEIPLKLDVGPYRVFARLHGVSARAVNSDMQGIASMDLWKGTVQSEVLILNLP